MIVRWIPPSFAGHTSCVGPMSQNWSRRLLQVLCLRSSLHRDRLRLGEVHWLPEACNNWGTDPCLGHHIAVHCCLCQVSSGPTLQSCAFLWKVSPSEWSPWCLKGALSVYNLKMQLQSYFRWGFKAPQSGFSLLPLSNSGPNDFTTFSTVSGLGISWCLCDRVPSSAIEHLVSGASVSTQSLLLVPLFVTSHHSWSFSALPWTFWDLLRFFSIPPGLLQPCLLLLLTIPLCHSGAQDLLWCPLA